jgi:hypothetical protein
METIMQKEGYKKIPIRQIFVENPGVYFHINPTDRMVKYLGKLKTRSPEFFQFEHGKFENPEKNAFTEKAVKPPEIYVKNEETPSSGGKRRRHKKSRKQSRHHRRRGCKQTRRRHAKRN